MELSSVSGGPELPPEAEKQSGLLGFLGLGHKPEAQVTAALPSAGFSGGSFPEPDLSREAENILAGVPEHIGGEADDAGGPGDVSEPGEVAGALVPVGPVSPEMAGVLLRAVGDSLERWRKFEGRYQEWGESTAKNAGALWAGVANTAWDRYAPLLFRSAEGAFPGLTAALTVSCVPLFLIALDDRMRPAKPGRGPGGPDTSAGPQVVTDAPRRPKNGGIVFD